MGLTERHWFENEDVPENYEWALEDAVYNSAMLKEQEAKNPIRTQKSQENPDGSVDYWAEYTCPACNKMIAKGFSIRFPHCMWCGQAVKWE